MKKYLMLAIMLPSMAIAHSWYDVICCDDTDCAPIHPKHVTAGPEGYTIVLKEGDHPNVKRGGTWFIKYDSWQDKQSHDTEFHACVNPSSEVFYCLYSPVKAF